MQLHITCKVYSLCSVASGTVTDTCHWIRKKKEIGGRRRVDEKGDRMGTREMGEGRKITLSALRIEQEGNRMRNKKRG